MKKKCMAVGGTAKKPATMEEQLAGIRGKVRPGYQAGGTVYRSGNSFTDQQIGDPMKGIAGAGMSSQVDNMLDRTKTMPNSIASPPQYGGSVIPAQTGQQTMQAATNFGMPPAGTAPTATSQTISTGDYSTGPRQGGFVDEYGKPRTTPAQDAQAEAAARQAEIAARSNEQLDNIASMKGLSDRQRVAAVSGIAANASRSGVGTDIAGALGVPMSQLSNKQQLRVSQAQYGVDMQEDGLTQPARRGYRRGYAGGGIVDKLIRVVEKVIPPSNNEKYEPGIQSRASEDPARHGRAEAMNPRTQTASSETPPAGGFQEEAERRRKQMKEAMSYEDGGMVKFAGKGGPRDDQIPVKVAGEEINVSNGENAVILPAKTAANPAALYAIGGIIQATNDGRKPKMGMEKGGAYKNGAYPYDDKSPPTAQEVYAGASPAGMVQAITPDSWRTARVVAPAGSVGGGMSSSGTDPRDIPEGGTITNLAPALQQIHNFAKPAYDLSPSMRALGTVGSAVGNVFADSAEAQRQGTTYGAVKAARVAGEENAARQAVTHSNEGRPSALGQAYQSYKPQAQGISAGVANDSGAVVKDGMTTTQMGAGFDPTKLQMAPGYGMASNAAGKTIAVGPAEYVGADGRPTSRWADTQQYADAIARNERDKLRLAEMQAQRLGADPMAVQKASQGISQSVMQAPLDARVKQQQIQQGDIAAQNANELRALYEAHKAAKTPEERSMYEDAIRVRTGKDKPEEFAHAAGGTTINPTTMGVEKTPDVIYSKRTGKPPGGTPQMDITGTAEANKIKADYQAKKITKEQANAALAKLEGR